MGTQNTRADRPALQGDYLDPMIEESANKMADGKYAKIPEGVREDDVKKYWARTFKLRDQILRDRGQEPPVRKIGASSPPAGAGAGTEILRKLDGIEKKLDKLLSHLWPEGSDQPSDQEEIPF